MNKNFMKTFLCWRNFTQKINSQFYHCYHYFFQKNSTQFSKSDPFSYDTIRNTATIYLWGMSRVGGSEMRIQSQKVDCSLISTSSGRYQTRHLSTKNFIAAYFIPLCITFFNFNSKIHTQLKFHRSLMNWVKVKK